MNEPRLKRSSYTKEFFKEFVKYWDTMNTEQLAQKFECSHSVISSVAARIRKMGYDLPKKRMREQIDHLMREALEEINFPKK